jgi:acetyl-CoA carboxylase biotin carboxyl carrier protein
MQFSLQAVRDVARLLHETELTEITVEDVDGETGEPFRMVLKRSALAPASTTPSQRPVRPTGTMSTQTAASAAPVTSAAGTNQPTSSASDAEETGPKAVDVLSTAVGLFRQSSPPLQVGDMVKRKQVVGVVESLKIPNEIAAPIAGRIEALLAEDGQGIEYGQTLLTIMPDDSA